MWVTDDDTSILNRRGNVVREREVVGVRFETDNGTDKTLSSIPGRDIWEKSIKERERKKGKRERDSENRIRKCFPMAYNFPPYEDAKS